MLQRPRIIRLIVAGMLLGTTMLVSVPSAPAKPRCTREGHLRRRPPGRHRRRQQDLRPRRQRHRRGGAGERRRPRWHGKRSSRRERREGRGERRPGADTIVVTDGAAGDRAVGGPGKDTCYIDRGDRTRGCETKTVVG